MTSNHRVPGSSPGECTNYIVVSASGLHCFPCSGAERFGLSFRPLAFTAFRAVARKDLDCRFGLRPHQGSSPCELCPFATHTFRMTSLPAQKFETLTKPEFCDLLIVAVSNRVAQFKTDLASQSSSMSSINLEFYLEGQTKLISKWGELGRYIERNRDRTSSKIEDGALVKLSSGKAVRWIYIFNLESAVEVFGEKVEINDGCLSGYSSIKDAVVGDSLKLLGDERGLPDLDIKILRIL